VLITVSSLSRIKLKNREKVIQTYQLFNSANSSPRLIPRKLLDRLDRVS
jgi:hypothetical protein